LCPNLSQFVHLDWLQQIVSRISSGFTRSRIPNDRAVRASPVISADLYVVQIVHLVYLEFERISSLQLARRSERLGAVQRGSAHHAARHSASNELNVCN
jgi:hypothetical protein